MFLFWPASSLITKVIFNLSGPSSCDAPVRPSNLLDPKIPDWILWLLHPWHVWSLEWWAFKDLHNVLTGTINPEYWFDCYNQPKILYWLLHSTQNMQTVRSWLRTLGRTINTGRGSLQRRRGEQIIINGAPYSWENGHQWWLWCYSLELLPINHVDIVCMIVSRSQADTEKGNEEVTDPEKSPAGQESEETT